MNSSQFSNPIIKAPTAVTQANMRISAVDGTAFVDFSASAFSADNVRNNDWVEIFDSAKRKIGGFIKATGSEVTRGSELITSWNNVNYYGGGSVDGYETFTPNANGHDIDVAINTNANGGAYTNTIGTIGCLYELVYSRTINSGGTPVLASGQPNHGGLAGGGNFSIAAAPSGTYYRTFTVAQSIYMATNDYGEAQNFSATFALKQVLTPSATGVNITNTPGGATYNWGVKDANFNYNDTSGYTYRIISRQAYGTLISSQNVTSSDLHIATVDGGAMFFHASIDYSWAAGDDAGVTLYEMVFEDVVGKVATAYAAAQGGGESLSENKFDDPGFADTSKWNKDTGWDVSGGKGVATGAVNNTFIGQLNKLTVVGGLYKQGAELTDYTSGAVFASSYGFVGPNITSLGVFTSYQTQYDRAGNPGFGSRGTSTLSIDSAFAYQVLDIPTTGLHLVSAVGGTTRNMRSVDSGFDPNTVVKVRVYRTGQTQ